jgi:hypothetical protein
MANLSGAVLESALLSGANIYITQVSGAELDFADLTDATYAPKSEPPDPYVVGIRGLATIRAFRDDARALSSFGNCSRTLGSAKI